MRIKPIFVSIWITAIVGCSTIPKSNEFIGSWQSDNGEGTTHLEIKENGVAIIRLRDELGGEQPEETVNLKWSVDDQKQLVLEEASSNLKQMMHFENGSLFAAEGGRTLKFERNDMYNNFRQ